MSHTPGPWIVREQWYIARAPQNGVSHGTHAEVKSCRGIPPDSDQHAANAILIAAAPDMLNALHAALFAMTNQRYQLPRIGMEREYQLVTEAIARATGETTEGES